MVYTVGPRNRLTIIITTFACSIFQQKLLPPLFLFFSCLSILSVFELSEVLKLQRNTFRVDRKIFSFRVILPKPILVISLKRASKIPKFSLRNSISSTVFLFCRTLFLILFFKLLHSSSTSSFCYPHCFFSPI